MPAQNQHHCPLPELSRPQAKSCSQCSAPSGCVDHYGNWTTLNSLCVLNLRFPRYTFAPRLRPRQVVGSHKQHSHVLSSTSDASNCPAQKMVNGRHGSLLQTLLLGTCASAESDTVMRMEHPSLRNREWMRGPSLVSQWRCSGMISQP